MQSGTISSHKSHNRSHQQSQYKQANHSLKSHQSNYHYGVKNLGDNSMLKNEEKERQRQEARAQREKTRRDEAHPVQNKNEALFTMVQVSPTPGQDRFQISDILGDFSEISKSCNTRDLIGVDHQPPTPAPAAHVHDPDNYFPPPPSFSSQRRSNHPSSAHRGTTHASNTTSTATPSSRFLLTGNGPSLKLPYQNPPLKYSEDVRPSLKSGPGPGPGTDTGSGHLEGKGGASEITTGTPLSMKRPRTQDRTIKDPQVQKIMSEMNDLKSPLSAMLQTPRPDHQSTFTFPPPSNTLSSGSVNSVPTSSKMPRSVLQSKLLKKSNTDDHLQSAVPQKSNDVKNKGDFQLSEESDEEIQKNSTNYPSFSKQFEEIRNPPISPMKNTDESSNSDDSSVSDSESSSSDEEQKHTSLPPSPQPTGAKNPWSLESIFQQSNKDDAEERGVKCSSDGAKNFPVDSIPVSPKPISEPAPPVITTVPKSYAKGDTSSRLPVVRKREAKTPQLLQSSDESSDSERITRPSPKPQKRVLAHLRPKPIFEPNLSSESEDEKLSSYSTTAYKGESASGHHRKLQQSFPKSAAGVATKNRIALQSIKTKNGGVMIASNTITKQASTGILNSDSDGSNDSVDVINVTPDKVPIKKSCKVVADKHCVSSVPSSSAKKKVESNSCEYSSKTKSPRIGTTKDVKLNPASVVSSKNRRDRKNMIPTSPSDLDSSPPPPPPPHSPEENLLAQQKSCMSATIPPTRSSSNKKCSSKKFDESKKKHSDDSHKENQPNLLKSHHRKKRRASKVAVEEEEKEKRGTDPQLSLDKLKKVELDPPARLQDQSPHLCLSPYAKKPQLYNESDNVIETFDFESYPGFKFENGIPSLLCSIPINLINNLPNKVVNNRKHVKREKVDKEVLEMRTNSFVNDSVSSDNNNNQDLSRNSSSSSSPPNEDKTKIKAICSIYRKRPSSVEHDKLKRELKAETPENVDVQKLDDALVPPESRSRSRKASSPQHSSPSVVVSSPVKRNESPSLEPHLRSKKRKKDKTRDKRKEKERSASKDGENRILNEEISGKGQNIVKRCKRSLSPTLSLEGSRKRQREEKEKKHSIRSYDDDVCNSDQDDDGLKENDCLKRTRIKQEQQDDDLSSSNFIQPRRLSFRQTSEEPSYPTGPSTSSSRKAITSNQFSPKGMNCDVIVGHRGVGFSSHDSYSPTSSSVPAVNSRPPYCAPTTYTSPEERISEDDELATHNLHGYSSLARNKVAEDPQASSNSGDTSEYHSLPSSEHGGSSAYRSGEERITPPLGLAVPSQSSHLDSYSMHHSIVPEMEYHANMMMVNQDPIVSGIPVYISLFEKKIPDILKDNTQYLSRAKELKHQADKERHRILQTIVYLEAVLYFILTGESMECDPSTFASAFTMFSDTYKLIRFVSHPIFKLMADKKDIHCSRISVILSILSLRCQSLLSLKLYHMKRSKVKEAYYCISDYHKNFSRQLQSGHPSAATPASSVGGVTPNRVSGNSTTWGSHRSAANHSPASLSPTPSPAGSVGSEGSQSSSGYSTEGAARHQQRPHQPPMSTTPPQVTHTISMPADLHNSTSKYCQLSFNLYHSFEMWLEADGHVMQNNIKDFFIDLDRVMGPLTLHSSLRELVNYVQKALDRLKKCI